MKNKVVSQKSELLLLGLYIFACLAFYVYLSSESVRAFWGAGGCILNETTGLYCPACGGTRAMVALFSGNTSLAFAYNQLIIFLPLALYPGILLIKLLIKGESIKQVYVPPILAWGFLGVIIFYGVLRNLPLAALDYLRP